MSLCEYCEKGQLEMCRYFRENFLEQGTAVHSCPEFEKMEPEEEELFEETIPEYRYDRS